MGGSLATAYVRDVKMSDPMGQKTNPLGAAQGQARGADSPISVVSQGVGTMRNKKGEN